MLEATPEIAGYSFATAVILGDADRVRTEIGRDPAWPPGPTPAGLDAAARGLRLPVAPARPGPGRGPAGRGPDAAGRRRRPQRRTGGQGGHGGWTPLRCAVAGAANPPITRLLLERGAVPGDDDLYLAGFGDDNHECLRLLLHHAADVAQIARMALAAPISTNDTEGVRLLLEAGADPNRYADDADPPSPVVYAAVRSGCSAELTGLLLAHGADPDAPGPDGRSPYALATVQGRVDLATLLRRYGAADDIAGTDRFLAACQHADQAAVEQQLTHDPGLPGRLTAAQQAAAMVHAAKTGHTPAVALMLDLGFPVDARDGDDGATALHAAAYSGNAPAVRLLLDRGADIEARDATWNSTPIEWAAVGSGERPADQSPPRLDRRRARPCSRRAPRPRTSASHPMTPSRPAPKSRPSCVATANPHRTIDGDIFSAECPSGVGLFDMRE